MLPVPGIESTLLNDGTQIVLLRRKSVCNTAEVTGKN